MKSFVAILFATVTAAAIWCPAVGFAADTITACKFDPVQAESKYVGTQPICIEHLHCKVNGVDNKSEKLGCRFDKDGKCPSWRTCLKDDTYTAKEVESATDAQTDDGIKSCKFDTMGTERKYVGSDEICIEHLHCKVKGVDTPQTFGCPFKDDEVHCPGWGDCLRDEAFSPQEVASATAEIGDATCTSTAPARTDDDGDDAAPPVTARPTATKPIPRRSAR